MRTGTSFWTCLLRFHQLHSAIMYRKCSSSANPYVVNNFEASLLTPFQEEFVKAALNRSALGSFPPTKWPQWLQEGLMTVAPKGLDQLVTTLCGSSANGKITGILQAWNSPCLQRPPSSLRSWRIVLGSVGPTASSPTSPRRKWVSEHCAIPNAMLIRFRLLYAQQGSRKSGISYSEFHIWFPRPVAR